MPSHTQDCLWQTEQKLITVWLTRTNAYCSYWLSRAHPYVRSYCQHDWLPPASGIRRRSCIRIEKKNLNVMVVKPREGTLIRSREGLPGVGCQPEAAGSTRCDDEILI